MAVNRALGPSSSSKPVIEFQNQKNDNIIRKISGEYCGQETIHNLRYDRVLIKTNSEWCRGESTIELLIPMDAGSFAEAILRDTLTEKIRSGIPINIILRRSFDPMPPESKYGDITSLLPQESWNGYTSTIIIQEGLSSEGITIAYRYGPETNDVRKTSVDASELKWVCRNEGLHVTSLILMPFTVGCDIITLPIQYLYLLWNI
jgi:hypothetical protein